jgi:hypothetical protein
VPACAVSQAVNDVMTCAAPIRGLVRAAGSPVKRVSAWCFVTSASPVRAKTLLDDELGSLGPGRPVDRERKDCRSPERLANRRPRKTFRLRKAETDRLGKTVVELRKTRWLCTWNGEAKAEFFWLCFSPGIFCLLFMSCIFPSAIDVALVFQMNWEILFLSFWGKARRTSSRTE